MPEVEKKFYYSDRLPRITVSDSGPFGKIEEIVYTKDDKSIVIREKNVGFFQHKLLQNMGAVLACFTNTIIGLCETWLMNCTEEIINDKNEVELSFREGMRIPYSKLVVTPQQITILSKVIAEIVARTEEKYPDLRFKGQNKSRKEEVEVLLWESAESPEE